MTRWRRSGQGNPNFYPGFCDNNPVSVFLFYIFADANEAGESDLQLCAESLMDSALHSNSMMQAQSSQMSHDASTESPSPTGSRPRKSRKRGRGVMAHVNSTLMQLTSLLELKYRRQEEETARAKKKRDLGDEDPLGKLIDQRVQYLQRRKVLVDLGDESSLRAVDRKLLSLQSEIDSLDGAAAPAAAAAPSVVDVTAGSGDDVVDVTVAVAGAGARLKPPMWTSHLPDHESLRKLMDMVPKEKFVNGAGGYDEGFPTERWVECDRSQKKVNIVKIFENFSMKNFTSRNFV